jgi:signal transduction histidine kinase
MSIASSFRAYQPYLPPIVIRARMRQALILLAYGCLFTALHHFAARWAAGSFFSLWFPAAGLRFALLWRMGARMTPAAAGAELLVQLVSGEANLGTSPALAVLGIVGPCLVYGLVIHLVRSRGGRRSRVIGLAPLPFALAAVIGPVIACVAALPWAVPLAMQNGPIDGQNLFHSLLVFTVGDLLGVLIVAPPLLWLADYLAGGRRAAFKLAHPAQVAEAAVVTAVAWSVVWAIYKAGLGVMLSPVLLATCWTGLRAGRPGAWLSIIVTAIVVLPMTGQGAEEIVRLRLSMVLASIAAVGYLAGSFAEAEARSHAELERRNRLLYQAERLKTLRAMSVAVIHEISQPLSTICIEANELVAASSAPDLDREEIASTSRLIARKAQDLSQMVRRLRAFGDRSADLPSRLSIPVLLQEIATIAAAEAKSLGVDLLVQGGPDALVSGQDVELRQALLNLLRNAIAASPRPGRVVLAHAISGDRLLVSIENDYCTSGGQGAGMGVGLIIARSIASAHGGVIREERPSRQRYCYILDLPLAGETND